MLGIVHTNWGIINYYIANSKNILSDCGENTFPLSEIYCMAQPTDYSTKSVSSTLLREVERMLLGLEYGSVELYVSDSIVTQITKRQITKTNGDCTHKKYGVDHAS